MAFSKIDENGNFTRFPGVTIIAPVETAQDEKNNSWHKLSDALSKSNIITEYYSILPYQSYHMTTCNLFTQANCSGDWNTFITENRPFFQKINCWLKNNPFSPTAVITESCSGGALQIVLKLPDEQRKIIAAFAEQFNLKNYVPPFFHITLAYGYKDFDDQIQYDKLRREFDRIISPFMEQQIKLKSPLLTSFETMKQFTPWDGNSNPFVEPGLGDLACRYLTRLFFGKNDSLNTESGCATEHLKHQK